MKFLTEVFFELIGGISLFSTRFVFAWEELSGVILEKI